MVRARVMTFLPISVGNTPAGVRSNRVTPSSFSRLRMDRLMAGWKDTDFLHIYEMNWFYPAPVDSEAAQF